MTGERSTAKPLRPRRQYREFQQVAAGRTHANSRLSTAGDLVRAAVAASLAASRVLEIRRGEPLVKRETARSMQKDGHI
jgi:hypothetical protein